MALSSSPVPPGLFDGVATSDDEARELAFNATAARWTAKMRAAAKQGLQAYMSVRNE